ncbi:phytanoyl-CoA dioxygenase, peroxisomal-like [Oratosquilla oratoria]|uniref:phytanoyl-CoA dioxygenase, peroxisomal-like n=1 Tax=Oratosquilla oratoria TaxID=337810 RepID=UPI003F77184E
MKFLKEDQKRFYNEQGYLVLDLLSEEEIQELSDEYDRVFNLRKHENTEATWQGDWKKENKKMEVKSIHGMQMFSDAYTRLLLNKKLLDACEDIMDTSNILLHHTKAHLKPPGTGSPFPMHQDYHYFPFEKDSMIAVFISLDASNTSNGGLCVYPGSHLLGPQEDKGTQSGWHYCDQTKFPIEKATPLALTRGQVVVFSYLLVHGSYTNASDGVRRMHLIQLMSAEDKPLKDMHNSLCQGMVLRGENVHRKADISKRHHKE